MDYMQLKNFKEIESEIIDLSRKEQYPILLQTFEWNNFRNKIVEKDNHCCLRCGEKEGLVLEAIPFEEQMQRIEDDINWKINFNEELLGKKMIEEERQNFIKKHKSRSTLSKEKVIGEIILNVHHNFYLWDCLPWQYNLSHLQTLCIDCHKKIHSEEKILTYFNYLKEEFFQEKLCDKCEGTGYIDIYKHVQDGICFNCWGRGLEFNETPQWINTTK